MNGGPNTEDTITVACIIDCSTIMVHTGKCYKALIDLGEAISLIQYSKCQHIDNSFKTPIQPSTAKLETADSSPMTASGMTALHLRIADFKFTHNFVICNRLTDTENYFWNRHSEEILHILHMGQRKKLLHTKRWDFFLLIHETVNRRPQLALSNHHIKYH